MKIVTCEKRKDTTLSINFIDSNDLFIGFATDTCCCEHAGWFVSDSPTMPKDVEYWDINEGTQEELDGYNFMPIGSLLGEKLYEEIKAADLDEGHHVCFPIINKEGMKYLHFFNCHNGYYGHSLVFNYNQDELHLTL